jgi:hypothetical protein
VIFAGINLVRNCDALLKLVINVPLPGVLGTSFAIEMVGLKGWLSKER